MKHSKPCINFLLAMLLVTAAAVLPGVSARQRQLLTSALEVSIEDLKAYIKTYYDDSSDSGLNVLRKGSTMGAVLGGFPSAHSLDSNAQAAATAVGTSGPDWTMPRATGDTLPTGSVAASPGLPLPVQLIDRYDRPDSDNLHFPNRILNGRNPALSDISTATSTGTAGSLAMQHWTDGESAGASGNQAATTLLSCGDGSSSRCTSHEELDFSMDNLSKEMLAGLNGLPVAVLQGISYPSTKSEDTESVPDVHPEGPVAVPGAAPGTMEVMMPQEDEPESSIFEYSSSPASQSPKSAELTMTQLLRRQLLDAESVFMEGPVLDDYGHYAHYDDSARVQDTEAPDLKVQGPDGNDLAGTLPWPL